MGHRRAAQEWRQKADEADNNRFFPVLTENYRVEFDPREKSEDDRAGSSEKCDPRLLRSEKSSADARPNNQLRHRADHNLRQSSRDPQLDCDEHRKQCQTNPNGSQKPDLSHLLSPNWMRRRCAGRGIKKTPAPSWHTCLPIQELSALLNGRFTP